MTADSGEPTGFPARAYPLYTAPSMHHAVKVQYGVHNPGEVGSTAVFQPSWICVNSVRKVANATLQSFYLSSGICKECRLFSASCLTFSFSTYRPRSVPDNDLPICHNTFLPYNMAGGHGRSGRGHGQNQLMISSHQLADQEVYSVRLHWLFGLLTGQPANRCVE